MPVLPWQPRNGLLAALPESVWVRLSMQRVHLPAGAVLCEPGLPMCDLVFPESAIVAISYAMESGGSAEVALIGGEGLVGVRLLLGATHLNVRARVLCGGSAVKLPTTRLLAEMAQGGALARTLLHYAASYIEQIVHTAACNRYGSVEQRLCRWLLLNLDRMPGNELTMTQELIAEALGVKREGITEAAGRLRREGAIDYRRGHITVLDRCALERHAGEFYSANRCEFDRRGLASA